MPFLGKGQEVILSLFVTGQKSLDSGKTKNLLNSCLMIKKALSALRGLVLGNVGLTKLIEGAISKY